MKDNRKYRNLYLSDVIGCLDHLVEFLFFPEYIVEQTKDDPCLYITVQPYKFYYDSILPPRSINKMEWKYYFTNHFFHRFIVLYKMLWTKDYYAQKDPYSFSITSVYEMEIQNEDLYSLLQVLYMVPTPPITDSSKTSFSPLFITDDTEENYVLRVGIRKIDKDFPSQIGLSVFYDPDLPFGSRFWNAFKYFFGFHPREIEFELSDNRLEIFKDIVQRAIAQWEAYSP
jgi:hypothetical protein